jgi:alpha-glucosidase (family GH31 glycosyl hydrolase)
VILPPKKNYIPQFLKQRDINSYYLSGYVGGYTGSALFNLTRSKELLLRWAEYAAFTPLMRTHEGNQPAANHQESGADNISKKD